MHNDHNLLKDYVYSHLEDQNLFFLSKKPVTFYTIDCESPPDNAPCSRPLPQFAARPPQYMYILTSFQGLVCLGVRKNVPILWNPVTTEYKRPEYRAVRVYCGWRYLEEKCDNLPAPAHHDIVSYSNLTGNNFTRPLPAELLAKSKKRSLFLSIEEIADQDKGYCLNGSCKNKKQARVVIPVMVAIATVIMLLTASAIVWMMIKRKNPKDTSTKEGSFKPSNQHYTYFEVRSITNNLKTVIGKGGFGTVFRGSIGDNQVAVKILSESSSQGYKEFQAEVNYYC
ncbi:leucine-rich repeat transmembrane protein kinase protein [Tanacetum coccineum]|uniref:Leucine-rich repeat transmembrane protein kinase protein n=1 Tax=Tanacetum coccineum TaxID=301880 RepID=A0ABQ5F1I8_9ASTR